MEGKGKEQSKLRGDKDSSKLRCDWELMRTAQGRNHGNHRKAANRQMVGQDVFNHADVHSLNSNSTRVKIQS